MQRLTVTGGAMILVILLVGHTFANDIEDPRKIVVFRAGTLESVKQLVVTLSGSQVVHRLSLINAMAIELPVNLIDRALTFLLNHAAVAEVHDDLIGLVDPIIPLPRDQEPQQETYDWGLQQIGIAAAHEERPTWMGTGVTVAILDTGIDGRHSELRNHIVSEYNARPRERSNTDEHGHGTHIAGIIGAALNGKGVVGVAPKVSLAAVKVLGAGGWSYLRCHCGA